MDSFDLVRIREVWKRLFDIDLAQKRNGSPSVAVHIQQLEKFGPETLLADRLLAEINAGEPAEIKAKKRKRLPPQPESNNPGVTPADVFRIFGNGATTILTEADWLEVPLADRQAILDEAARWAYEDGVFRGDGQWCRTNVVARIQGRVSRRGKRF
jgi:hypothetical protein